MSIVWQVNVVKIGKFSERPKLTKTDSWRSRNVSRSVSVKAIECITENLPTKKTPGQRAPLVKSIKYLIKKIILIPSKNKGKGNYGPVSLMNIDQKIFNKILEYQCQRWCEKGRASLPSGCYTSNKRLV